MSALQLRILDFFKGLSLGYRFFGVQGLRFLGFKLYRAFRVEEFRV